VSSACASSPATTFLNDRPLGQPTPVRPGDVIRLAESRVIVEGPDGAVAPPSDGLAGRADEVLSGSTILRPAAPLLFPEGAAPGPGETTGLAGRLRVLNEVHRALARDNERAMFVTAFAARLDLTTGELEYVNAGHNPTYRLEPGRAPAPLGGPVDPALGAVEGHEYRESVVRLRPGDALVLYTDGVVEARNASGEEFHALRLESYLDGCRDTAAADVVRGLVGRLEDFAGDTPQYDDVPILVLRVLGLEGRLSP